MTTILIMHKQEIRCLPICERKKTVKGERRHPYSYLTGESEYKNFYNPFAAGMELWQKSMANWLNVYGNFVQNGAKIAEYWYNVYWKLFLDAQKQQYQYRDKVKVD